MRLLGLGLSPFLGAASGTARDPRATGSDLALPCGPGAQVLPRHPGGRGATSLARVLRRPPGGAVLVRWGAAGAAEAGGPNATALLPAAALRTPSGGPCARAILCLFGRVGNLHGKFGEAGSTVDALLVSAPSIMTHIVDANPEFSWDVVAQTWDEHLAGDVALMFRPLEFEASPQPNIDAVHSFAEAIRRAAGLKTRVEARGKFRYDLALLMRYDILWRSPLRLAPLPLGGRLWTGHWCSVHAEDLSVREVVLSTTRNTDDVRWQTRGIFAPSQFVESGLHDWWFAASSADIDSFASWGESIGAWQAMYGLSTDELPVHVGHFYTFLHARNRSLTLTYTGVSYVDYTLVRWRNCRLHVGNVIGPVDFFCSHWEISIPRQCNDWHHMPAGWATRFCPLAGRQATLEEGSQDCGRF